MTAIEEHIEMLTRLGMMNRVSAIRVSGERVEVEFRAADVSFDPTPDMDPEQIDPKPSTAKDFRDELRALLPNAVLPTFESEYE